MGLHPDRPADLARDMLEAVAGYYQANGLALPYPRFVTTGQVVADCELAAVSVQRLFSHAGDVSAEVVPGVRAHVGHAMRGMVAAVSVLRCVPTLDEAGDPPPADAVEDGARLVLADAQHTWNALYDAHRDGRLTSCNSLVWGGWDAYGPEGGIAGGFLIVRAGLE